MDLSKLFDVQDHVEHWDFRFPIEIEHELARPYLLWNGPGTFDYIVECIGGIIFRSYTSRRTVHSND